MHAIHHTQAIVVRSEPAGEANKRIWLFTKEFGLVIAMVQGVRKPHAKLQSHISDYSLINADLIRGKNTWRLISARVIDVPLLGKERSPLARAYVRTIVFLERFLIGEGVNEELYDHILTFATMVRSDSYDARALDALSLWKMLVLLGYIAVEDMDELLFTSPIDQTVAFVDEPRMKKLIKSATDAISYSHL